MANKDLDSGKLDIALSLSKGALGAIPIAGAALGEMLSLTIPNQRLDRVTSFIRELEKRITDIEQEKLKDNEYFVDLMEDAILQSTKSLSEKRNQYIAIFLSNNKNITETDFSIKKKLLHKLEELTDTDIEILKSFRERSSNHAYYKYGAQEQPIGYVKGLNEEELYMYELGIATWDAHLSSLENANLIRAIHKMPPDDPDINQQYLDEETGLPEVIDHEITELGKVLLKSIEENSIQQELK